MKWQLEFINDSSSAALSPSKYHSKTNSIDNFEYAKTINKTKHRMYLSQYETTIKISPDSDLNGATMIPKITPFSPVDQEDSIEEDVFMSPMLEEY